MQVTTTDSHQIWQSPDGKRTIWEVTLKAADGSDYKLKTYSSEIAKPNWSGEVRSYMTPRGDRFVRQIPHESTSKGGYQRDDNAIRAQWAIGQAINLASVKMDKDAITMPVIEKYARELYETVSRVKGEKLSEAEQKEADQYIKGLTQSTVF